MELKSLIEAMVRQSKQDDQLVIALSGGVDSGLVAAAAQAAWHCGAHGPPPLAVTVQSELTAQRDFERAGAVARHIGIRHAVITLRMLEIEAVRDNGTDRCYHCKLALFDSIRRNVGENCVIADGTNGDDDPARPGLRAAKERGVLHPLKRLGIDKARVRRLARAAGLPNWNEPSESCLATRLAPSIALTREGLAKVERLESFWIGLGVEAVRVRHDDLVATVEYPMQYAGIIEKNRDPFLGVIRSAGLRSVQYREWSP
ncbi:asparagine synthase-related protein [Pseudodesulfovibrio alkaliphilus]|nr:asparagine synthase-related protein [Pseudodesulfovibrio alkaliphilus]